MIAIKIIVSTSEENVNCKKLCLLSLLFDYHFPLILWRIAEHVFFIQGWMFCSDEYKMYFTL